MTMNILNPMKLLFLTIICANQFSCMYMSYPVPESEIPKEESAFQDYSEAVILFENAEYNKALDRVNIAIDENDKISKFFLLRASILEKLGQPVDALNNYDIVLKLQSYNPQVHAKKGRLLASIGQYHSAIQCVKKASAQKPDETNFLLLIADYYVKLKSFERANNYLNLYKNQTKENNFNSEFFCIKAEIYFSESNYQEAINAIDKCRKSMTLNIDRNKLLLNAYINSEKYDMFYQHLMSLKDKTISKGDFHFYRGVYYFHKKNLQDALSQLNFALDFDTDESRVYYYLGKIHLDLGDTASSKKMFEIYRAKTEQPQLDNIRVQELDDS